MIVWFVEDEKADRYIFYQEYEQEAIDLFNEVKERGSGVMFPLYSGDEIPRILETLAADADSAGWEQEAIVLREAKRIVENNKDIL